MLPVNLISGTYSPHEISIGRATRNGVSVSVIQEGIELVEGRHLFATEIVDVVDQIFPINTMFWAVAVLRVTFIYGAI